MFDLIVFYLVLAWLRHHWFESKLSVFVNKIKVVKVVIVWNWLLSDEIVINVTFRGRLVVHVLIYMSLFHKLGCLRQAPCEHRPEFYNLFLNLNLIIFFKLWNQIIINSNYFHESFFYSEVLRINFLRLFNHLMSIEIIG